MATPKLGKKTVAKRVFCSLLCVALISPTFANATTKLDNKIDDVKIQVVNFSDNLNAKDRSEFFIDYVNNNFTYVTARTFAGKSGDWIAFADIYQEYSDGKEQRKFVLQGASVQYGLEKLPFSAESATLIIGKSKQKIDKGTQPSFSFDTQPLMRLQSTALKDLARVTVSSGTESASINLTQVYPSKGIPEHLAALGAMSEPFYEFLKEEGMEDFTFSHSFMKLKSFVTDVDKMEVGLTWELALVSADELPCESIIIRYDCETEKVSVVKRDTRSYFN